MPEFFSGSDLVCLFFAGGGKFFSGSDFVLFFCRGWGGFCRGWGGYLHDSFISIIHSISLLHMSK